jgi:hypothetical protein
VKASVAGEKWVREQLSRPIGVELPRSIALDFLLGESYARPWSVPAAHEAFTGAVVGAAGYTSKFMVALVIPLAPANGLRTSLPDEAALDLNEMEPPSLYLFDRRFFGQRFNDFEEYRSPIQSENAASLPQTVDAYYSCFRDPEARKRGWEYSRAMWYVHFD